jgi:hypothetical protein
MSTEETCDLKLTGIAESVLYNNTGPSPQLQSLKSTLPQKASSQHEAAASPSTAAYSHIRRLAEPRSTRKRSKREDIILLKASMVNGFKCPPWEKNPSPEEFTLQQGQDLFM